MLKLLNIPIKLFQHTNCLPYGHFSDIFVEKLAHADNCKTDVILHLYLLKKLVSNHLQGILWPCLKAKHLHAMRKL